jgi:hypothetical protein
VQTFPTNPLIGNGHETENAPIREDGLIEIMSRWQLVLPWQLVKGSN